MTAARPGPAAVRRAWPARAGLAWLGGARLGLGWGMVTENKRLPYLRRNVLQVFCSTSILHTPSKDPPLTRATF